MGSDPNVVNPRSTFSYQKDDITKVAKNLNAKEKSLKKAYFNKASLRSPFSDIDSEQN